MQRIGLKSYGILTINFDSTFSCRPKIPVRTKYKKIWAEYRRKKTYSELALAYFDVYHKKVYERQWPSMRLALLSARKYGALLNNFSSESEEAEQLLEDHGAKDIVSAARERHISLIIQKSKKHLDEPPILKVKGKEEITTEERKEPNLIDNQNIYEFVPSKRVYTDDELYAMEQYELSVYERRNLDIPTMPELELTLPNKLKMFCHDLDNIAYFPPPKPDGLGKLGYYLQDASSLLPVLALDTRPGDRILDLCSAPGGKSLALLQTLLPDIVVANDNSDGRRKRLVQVIKSYLPDNCNILIRRQDGKMFKESVEFDKVLVDVPCLTDRHVLHTDENNIFKPGRVSERITLPQTQLALLKAGLDNVCIDGNVVYSSCTLANAQNDGVVESALEYYHEKGEKRFAVVDISVLKQLFADVFFFNDYNRYGLLVIPNVRANFGPTYVSKIKRLE